jgi:hypothetical protein
MIAAFGKKGGMRHSRPLPATRRNAALAALLTALLALAGAGCAAVLPFMGEMALFGYNYHGKTCPSRTFTCGLECAHTGVLDALQSMSVNVVSDKETGQGRQVKASAKGLDINIDVVRLTDNTTRVDVQAAKNALQRDGATATEIVAQVGDALERRKAICPAASPQAKPSPQPVSPQQAAPSRQIVPSRQIMPVPMPAPSQEAAPSQEVQSAPPLPAAPDPDGQSA